MTTSKTPYRSIRRILFFAILFIVCGCIIFALISGFINSRPVTDAEARELVRTINSVALSDQDQLCQYALFEQKCLRMIDDGLQEQIGTMPKLICTWPLTGGDGTRVVEVENTNEEGKRYRTSVAVSRDFTRLTAWPMPYWVFPTREVPDETLKNNGTGSLPDAVIVGGDKDYDPCLNVRSDQ